MTEEFDESLPIIPNPKYEKFFAKFSEIETLPITEWKIAHLLGYFVKQYKKQYGIEYSWKFNTPSPVKCFEVWQIKALSSKLSSNPKILKEYIDWVYNTIVPNIKAKFRSISFITKDEIVNDYKMNVLLASQTGANVSRATLLPINYADILEANGYSSVKSYGDLAFLVQIVPMPEQLNIAFQKLAEHGFDKSILNRIV